MLSRGCMPRELEGVVGITGVIEATSVEAFLRNERDLPGGLAMSLYYSKDRAPTCWQPTSSICGGCGGCGRHENTVARWVKGANDHGWV